ncbi:MAG: type II secretion system protein GspE, partial [bacterium]|nr:type II secretion system protein GspE [bacterium]
KEIAEDIKKTLGEFLPNDKISLYRGKGCSECNSTGYFGRMGIFEVLPVTDKIAKLILEHAPASTVQDAAIAEGMITMKQDGYLKATEGLTTLEEVVRVAED